MASHEEREAALLAQIPGWYSGGAHFLALCGVMGGATLAALAQVQAPRPLELAFLPAFFVFANFLEWWLHRGPLHRPTAGLRVLYQRHTLTHHRLFRRERMAIRSARELKLVLFPPYVILALLLVLSPFLLGLGALTTPNTGWLCLASLLAYYLLYELLHTLHHLPPQSWLGRRRLVALLRLRHYSQLGLSRYHHHER